MNFLNRHGDWFSIVVWLLTMLSQVFHVLVFFLPDFRRKVIWGVLGVPTMEHRERAVLSGSPKMSAKASFEFHEVSGDLFEMLRTHLSSFETCSFLSVDFWLSWSNYEAIEGFQFLHLSTSSFRGRVRAQKSWLGYPLAVPWWLGECQ